MSGPRNARPTDIVALVAFDGRVYPNEARPWDRLGRAADGPHLITSAFEQWFSFVTGRATWVSVQGQTVRGVVSARRRGRLAWEIDTLIVAGDDRDLGLTLFDRVAAGAARAGAHKLLLRLEAGSDLTEDAHRAGFVTVARETLLRRADARMAVTPEVDAASPPFVLRTREKGDAYALFQLYCAVTPPEIRSVEAATFSEWLALSEERSSGRGRLDLVAERASRAVAWVRTAREAGLGRLDLVVHPEFWPATPTLIATALAALRPAQPAVCLVPDHARPVRGYLEQAGFEPCGDYVSLIKRLALTVREPRRARVPVPSLVKPLITRPVVPALHRFLGPGPTAPIGTEGQ
jgi:hypothetical protein